MSSIKRLSLAVFTSVLTLVLGSSPLMALPQQQLNLFRSGVYYYDIEEPEESYRAACALPGDNNEERTWNYLIGKGFTAIQAAGAMGNLKQEANFEPRKVEGGIWGGIDWPNLMEEIPPPVGPAGQPGYGVVQWTSPGRKAGLQKISDESGIPVFDLSLQLDYMWQELNQDYYKTRALDPLLASTTLPDATSIWQEKYEVGKHFEPRLVYAQEILAKYGSSTSTTSGCSDIVLSEGDAPELAQAILDAEGVTVAAKYTSQLENIAAGQTACPDINPAYSIDIEILRITATLAQTNSFTITSINRACTDVGSLSSPHRSGRALDIGGAINGATFSGFGGYNTTIQEFYNELALLMPSDIGCGIGAPNTQYVNGIPDSNCSNVFLDTPERTGATGPHVHFHVPSRI